MLWRNLKLRVERGTKIHKKIAVALKKVAPFIPDAVGSKVFIFLPTHDTTGCAFQYTGGPVIYLHPEIHRSSQSEVDFTVAHEFAHLVLNHIGKKSTLIIEREADVQACKWGFEKRFAYYLNLKSK